MTETFSRFLCPKVGLEFSVLLFPNESAAFSPLLKYLRLSSYTFVAWAIRLICSDSLEVSVLALIGLKSG